MTATLDESKTFADELRDLEENAPKTTPVVLRNALTKAAETLEDHRKFFEDASLELELVASLKVGVMDSDSRVMDISREQQASMAGVAARMRSFL